MKMSLAINPCAAAQWKKRLASPAPWASTPSTWMEYGHHSAAREDFKLDRSEVQRVKDLGLKTPNIHWTFAPGSLLPAINDPDPGVRQDNEEQIKRLADFCQAAGIASILVLPGVILPGQSLAEGASFPLRRCRIMLRSLMLPDW